MTRYFFPKPQVSRSAGLVSAAGREPARDPGVSERRAGNSVPSGSRGSGTPATGRATAERLAAMKAVADRLRDPDALTASEIRELDMLAFGYLRQQELRAQALAAQGARRLATRRIRTFARSRERALIASMGEPDAAVRAWSGVIGAEGSVTGDGRVIAFGALQWARFPLPLRWAKADVGGHDGAVIVGRIDKVTRRPDGTIWATGLIDLGSEDGKECARLMTAGMLSGISMDLDSVDSAPATVNGKSAALTTSGRVRAATLVAIPAFAQAQISLDDPDDDCDCETPTEPGLYTFMPHI